MKLMSSYGCYAIAMEQIHEALSENLPCALEAF